MAKELRCRDVGLDCDFETRGNSENEVVQKAAAHAKTHHQIDQMPPELEKRVREAIRTV